MQTKLSIGFMHWAGRSLTQALMVFLKLVVAFPAFSACGVLVLGAQIFGFKPLLTEQSTTLGGECSPCSGELRVSPVSSDAPTFR